MRETAALLSVVVLIIGTVWYCYLILKDRIQPALATWVIAAVAITISFAAYWETPEHTWLGNITNLAAAIEVWFVVAALFWALQRGNKLATELDSFQIRCLIVSAIIILGWKLTNQPTAAFVLIQSMIVVAYLATIERLIKWKRNPDSSFMWGAIMVASMFGLVPALIDSDGYGIANSIRAILSSGFTLVIMLRLDHAARQTLKIMQ